MTNAVETSGLRYSPGGRFTIVDLTLHVPEGAICGFLGPNGCDKTTTLPTDGLDRWPGATSSSALLDYVRLKVIMSASRVSPCRYGVQVYRTP
jgi:ABC-type uncharacterized transport system ATPase subunit